MRLPIILSLCIISVLAGTPARADDRVEACVFASMASGASVNRDQAGQSDDQVSFAVAPMVNQAVGITCVFDPAANPPQLTRLYWRFFPNGTAAIDTLDIINPLLAKRFAAPIPDADRVALSSFEAQAKAELAFTCAAWANVDEGRSIPLSEIERLTMYGYDLGLEAAAINKLPETLDQEKKIPGLYERAPLDFWVGIQWVQANEAVNRGLDYNVPNNGKPYEEWLALRAENASANFEQQGCADLGY